MLILFGAGFALHLLWIAAVVIAIVWVATFALGRGERQVNPAVVRWPGRASAYTCSVVRREASGASGSRFDLECGRQK